MNSRTKVLSFTALGLAVALAAGTALSAPQHLARVGTLVPPTAASLGLQGEHALRWDALRSETIALRRLAREEAARGAHELRLLLQQPDPDLRVYSVRAQQRVDAYVAESRALRERQLALYESLGPAEKQRVRVALIERLDRLDRIRGMLGPLVASE